MREQTQGETIMSDKQAIQDVIEAISRVAEEMECQNQHIRCEFTGYTFADSMGLIATSMTKIADALEKIANK